MKIRKLTDLDAPLMLEWMHDDDVIKFFNEDFKKKTLNDCLSFINYSNSKSNNYHFAIIDDNDEYLGTVSLKNVNDEKAEFAIVLRRVAFGKGVGKFAFDSIVKFGFETLNLKEIYWYVSKDNVRAIKFYMKTKANIVEKKESEYIWFVVENK